MWQDLNHSVVVDVFSAVNVFKTADFFKRKFLSYLAFEKFMHYIFVFFFEQRAGGIHHFAALFHVLCYVRYYCELRLRDVFFALVGAR